MHRTRIQLPLFLRPVRSARSHNEHTDPVLLCMRAALLALLLALIVAVPAVSAAVPGLQRVASPPTIGSSATQTAVATCPVGTKVIGTGGEVNGPTGRVVLRRIIPSSNLASVTASGAEIDGGTSSAWTVTAYAICADVAAVPDVELLQLNSSADSSALKSANVICPSGKRLLGSGAALFGQGTDRVVLFTAAPNGARSGAVAVGTELDSGTSASWNVRTYAICASALPGYQQDVASSGQASTPTQTAAVPAPSGTKVLGAGGTVNGQTGRLALTGIILAADLRSVTATGAEVGSGLTVSWSVGAYVIGATP